MAVTTGTVFSDYELYEMNFKFSTTAYAVNCVGSVEEEMENKVITKSCRGEVVKKVVKGTGNGALKITAHVPYEVYTKAYGMELSTLVDGVNAYGKNSKHEAFCLTMHIKDEDGNLKLKAYPNCVMNTGTVRKIENGAEEIAEMELEVGVMPDSEGNGVYEALESKMTSTAKTTWMESFTSELVKKTGTPSA